MIRCNRRLSVVPKDGAVIRYQLLLSSLVLFALFYAKPSVSGEQSVYNFSWLDQDKEIYVLQNRKYRKKGRPYFSLGGGLTVSGSFTDATSIQARGGFFFFEQWGIEFLYATNSTSTNNSFEGVAEQGAIAYFRQIESYSGAMLMWAPFYAKLNTFNKVLYFDWMLGAGMASVSNSDNRNKFLLTADSAKDELTSESQSGLLWSTGLRFYLSQMWSLRVDFTAVHFEADKTRKQDGLSETFTTKKWFHNYDLTAGINISF